MSRRLAAILSRLAPRRAVTTARSADRAVSGRSNKGFTRPTVTDSDLETNLEWNRQRWGQRAGWDNRDSYGYRWDGGYQQTVGQVARLADTHLRPHTDDRYDLNVLELSPGGGRFTMELVRYASALTLVDMNEECLEVCRDRFAYVPTPIDYVLNDGRSLPITDRKFDLIACYDSMVHMHPEVIEGYVAQMARLLSPDGLIWLDHSGKGQRDQGHRTDMTDERMRSIAGSNGLEVRSQSFRNDWDCISVLASTGEARDSHEPR